jgi:hypothetical protein
MCVDGVDIGCCVLMCDAMLVCGSWGCVLACDDTC